MNAGDRLRCRIRVLLGVFMLGLVVSGLTAIPLEWEVNTAARLLGLESSSRWPAQTSVGRWLLRVQGGVLDTGSSHPFISYGTDWLAFGHFMIALAFVGALRDPVRNRWLFDFGLLACALVVPYALLFGHLRGIPVWWRLIDCSFGVVGALPLWLAREQTRALQALSGSRT